MDITKIEKKNLVTEAYQQLYNMIISGAWKEGDKLPSENILARQLNVSRVVIREAMQQLRAKYLIVTRQGSGSFVANPRNFLIDEAQALDHGKMNLTEEQFFQLLEFRSCIEVPSLEITVEKATEDDFEKIRKALEHMKAGIGSVEEFSEADYEFHLALINATHNPFLIKAIVSCRDELYGCFCEMNKVNDSHDWGYEAHCLIADAVYERNKKKAVAMLNRIGDYNKLRYADFFAEPT